MRRKPSKWKIETHAGEVSRQKSGESDDEPFLEIKGLKQNLLGQFNRFAKWFEDLDLPGAAIHGPI